MNLQEETTNLSEETTAADSLEITENDAAQSTAREDWKKAAESELEKMEAANDGEEEE